MLGRAPAREVEREREGHQDVYKCGSTQAAADSDLVNARSARVTSSRLSATYCSRNFGSEGDPGDGRVTIRSMSDGDGLRY